MKDRTLDWGGPLGEFGMRPLHRLAEADIHVDQFKPRPCPVALVRGDDVVLGHGFLEWSHHIPRQRYSSAVIVQPPTLDNMTGPAVFRGRLFLAMRDPISRLQFSRDGADRIFGDGYAAAHRTGLMVPC